MEDESDGDGEVDDGKERGEEVRPLPQPPLSNTHPHRECVLLALLGSRRVDGELLRSGVQGNIYIHVLALESLGVSGKRHAEIRTLGHLSLPLSRR